MLQSGVCNVFHRASGWVAGHPLHTCEPTSQVIHSTRPRDGDAGVRSQLLACERGPTVCRWVRPPWRCRAPFTSGRADAPRARSVYTRYRTTHASGD